MSGLLPDLRNEVRRRGLLDLAPRWYTLNLMFHVALVGVTVALLIITRSLWIAPLMAFGYYQVGLLYHDFGHYQAYPERALNDTMGMVAGFVIGGSIARWRIDHDAHHGHTNLLPKDPDLEGPLAHTPQMARERKGFGRVLALTQHVWLLPLSCLMLMPIIRTKDLVHVFRRRYPRRRSELGLLLLHYGLYFALVFTVLPPGKGLAFIAIHQTLFGTSFALAFLINHTGMPARHEKPVDWIAAQIESTRNVRRGVVFDYLFGPLAPHIEHHAFPGMPRPQLREVSALLREYAKAKNVEFRELPSWQVHADLVRSLKEIGAHANAPPSEKPAN
jgi:fatty acid desaturase